LTEKQITNQTPNLTTMKLTDLIKTVLGMQTRLEAIEQAKAPLTPTSEKEKEKDEDAEAEGDEGKEAEADEDKDKEAYADLLKSVNEATTRLATLEANIEKAVSAAITAAETKLNAEFDTRVQAKAAEIAADKELQRAEPPVQTGPQTNADKTAIAGLKGRAKVAAAIAAERAGK
jgi:hypothetical protein